MKICLVLLFMIGLCPVVIGQNATNENGGKTHGVAIDMLPLLSEIFSDDGPDRLFRFGYIWKNEGRIVELGIAPQYRTTSVEINDLTGDDNNEFGLDLDFSVVKEALSDSRWLLMPGVHAGAGYNRLNSADENGFELKNTGVDFFLGALLRFGYAVHDRVWIRSEISGNFSYMINTEEILQNFFPPTTAEQTIKTFGFDFAIPDKLEIVYLF